jgi:hypothetical protein
LRYSLPQQTAATWASVAVGAALLAVPAGELWWERRRRKPGLDGAIEPVVADEE